MTSELGGFVRQVHALELPVLKVQELLALECGAFVDISRASAAAPDYRKVVHADLEHVGKLVYHMVGPGWS
jgi:hypothetical protein